MIKKLPHWTLYSEPGLPLSFRMPQKLKVVCSEKTLIDSRSGDHSDLSFLQGYDLSKIEVEINKEEDCEPLVDYYFVEYDETEDETYEERLKQYKYEIRKHEEDVKAWREWKKQEDGLLLQRQIEDAKNLLRKHGELK